MVQLFFTFFFTGPGWSHVWNGLIILYFPGGEVFRPFAIFLLTFFPAFLSTLYLFLPFPPPLTVIPGPICILVSSSGSARLTFHYKVSHRASSPLFVMLLSQLRCPFSDMSELRPFSYFFTPLIFLFTAPCHYYLRSLLSFPPQASGLPSFTKRSQP